MAGSPLDTFFIGGIPHSLQGAQLEEYFSQYGHVDVCRFAVTFDSQRFFGVAELKIRLFPQRESDMPHGETVFDRKTTLQIWDKAEFAEFTRSRDGCLQVPSLPSADWAAELWSLVSGCKGFLFFSLQGVSAVIHFVDGAASTAAMTELNGASLGDEYLHVVSAPSRRGERAKKTVTLMLGGLSADCSSKELTEELQRFGEESLGLFDVEKVDIPKSEFGNQISGLATVELSVGEEKDASDVAERLRELRVRRRSLTVLQKEERSALRASLEGSLFVGNVLRDTKVEDLSAVFERFPGFVSISMCPPKEGNSFHPSFANFASREAADVARLGSNGTVVNGSKVSVSFQSEKRTPVGRSAAPRFSKEEPLEATDQPARKEMRMGEMFRDLKGHFRGDESSPPPKTDKTKTPIVTPPSRSFDPSVAAPAAVRGGRPKETTPKGIGRDVEAVEAKKMKPSAAPEKPPHADSEKPKPPTAAESFANAKDSRSQKKPAEVPSEKSAESQPKPLSSSPSDKTPKKKKPAEAAAKEGGGGKEADRCDEGEIVATLRSLLQSERDENHRLRDEIRSLFELLTATSAPSHSDGSAVRRGDAAHIAGSAPIGFPFSSSAAVRPSGFGREDDARLGRRQEDSDDFSRHR